MICMHIEYSQKKEVADFTSNIDIQKLLLKYMYNVLGLVLMFTYGYIVVIAEMNY